MAWLVFLLMWMVSGDSMAATNVPKPLSLTSSLLGSGGSSTEDTEDDDDDEDDDDEDDDDEDDDDEDVEDDEQPSPSSAKLSTAAKTLDQPPIAKSLLGGDSAAPKDAPKLDNLSAPPPLPVAEVPTLSKKDKILASIMSPNYPCVWRCNAFANCYTHRRIMMLNYPVM